MQPWITDEGSYSYQKFPITAIDSEDSLFSAKPGNYIFAKQTPTTPSWPLYIGETSNLQQRLVRSHEKMDCVLREEATHIYTHENDDESTRKAEESDLVNFYDPPCNRNHIQQ